MIFRRRSSLHSINLLPFFLTLFLSRSSLQTSDHYRNSNEKTSSSSDDSSYLSSSSSSSSSNSGKPTYRPDWDSLDSRPIPEWYDEAKIGIFVHWGVFSVPAFVPPDTTAESFWVAWNKAQPGSVTYEFMKNNYRPDWTYADFASQFTAELFNADDWVELFKDAGAKYVVFVSKHLEGFNNWNTSYSFNWNSMQVGPKRDLVGEMRGAVRKAGLRLGLYHNLIDEFNPLYVHDRSTNYTSQLYVKEKMLPEAMELVNMYQPDLFWSDNGQSPIDYFQSKQFLTWLFNESPVRDHVAVNDRWGLGANCKHGGYWTCYDRYNPKGLQKKKWENCDTVQKSTWGYGRNKDLSDYQTIEEIITKIVQTISCGGNYLLNVGPTHDGRILPIFEERLRQMGAWLKANGEAVYHSKPWKYQNDTISGNVWYTQVKSSSSSSGYSVYAFVLDWPKDNTLVLGAPLTTPNTTVTMLGCAAEDNHFTYEPSGQGAGMSIHFPFIPPNRLPSFYTWVLRLNNLAN